MKRLRALDGLRTLAIALVFAHHVDQHNLPGGFIGVDLFFVISGFIITHLLLKEQEATGRIALGRFYVRRLLRLYPALLLLVLVTTPIAMIDNYGTQPQDGIFALSYLTDFWANYQGGYSLVLHTWSLAVEEQFYLIWPALLIFTLHRGWKIQRVVTVLIALSIVVTVAIYQAHIGRLSHIQFLPTSHIAELGSGILLAVWVRSDLPGWVKPFATEAAAILAVASLVVAEFVLPSRWWAFPLATVGCWPLVAHVVTGGETRFNAFFGTRPMVWMGRRSYGFYLWHYPVLLLLARTPMNTWLRAGLGLAITLFITVLSWQFVEQPVLRYKDARWHSRTTPAPATAAG
jgi:peptidoglycan/LPS O-acetylase OafA/YrhL